MTLLSTPTSLNPTQISGLTGSSRAYYVATQFLSRSNPIVLITPDRERGEVLLKDINFFLSVLDPTANVPVYLFPHWELLPYEPISPHTEIVGQRLAVLDNLIWETSPFVLIVTVEALFQRILPKEILAETVIRIANSDTLSMDNAREMAIAAGYRFEDLAERAGEASIRGGIFDIFPTNSDVPFRIELMGDEVESIREFAPATQRSVREVNDVIITPAKEIVFTDSIRKRGVEKIEARTFENQALYDGEKRAETEKILSMLSEGMNVPGMERFAPDYYGEMEALFDYLPDKTQYFIDEPASVTQKAEEFHCLINDEFEKSASRGEFFPSPETFYLSQEDLFARIDNAERSDLTELSLDDSKDCISIRAGYPGQFKGNLDDFVNQAKKWKKDGYKTVIAGHTKGQSERLVELLDEKKITISLENKGEKGRKLKEFSVLSIVGGALSSGTIIHPDKIVFVTETELFGSNRRLTRRKRRKRESFSIGFRDLRPGNLIVHMEYGVGKYIGTREMTLDGFTEEFLTLEYANEQKLFLPMDGLGVLQKYVGAGEAAPSLDKLGGTSWQKTKEKIKKTIREMAEGLLRLYATRKIVEGFVYSEDGHFHMEFADSFEFGLTEDQDATIQEVAKDMEESKPMDRLVCGDVGYGKTEVAMRAAFKAVMDGKQVAVLVPTTLLAQQHLHTFTTRFQAFPVKIDVLSRFRTPKQQKEIIKGVTSGDIDIIIGTHRLLQKDLVFHDIGLIVVDEEQRFGVTHKEKLKKLKERVDVLTLTATPIPRTLHFAMTGLRDISIIDTPPQNRLAIKTFVRRFDDEVIRQAIVRELDRGGQVYFVHNRVGSIYTMAKYVQELVPHAKIGVGHGQMKEHELEKVMLKFIDGELNVLVCTTIIESGLDIPMANTIIVNRSDSFGLAQLYQLRGRVGRDRHQAFAYLLVPVDSTVTDLARKRLAAIEELSDLGSGFKVAARDLELRGGGNMLGPQQSGSIAAVGFDLYCNLMEEAVLELKGESPDDALNPTVKTSFRGFIPKEYISDLNQRLDAYKKFDLVDSEKGLDELLEEISDRYGPIPEPVGKLNATVRFKVFCRILKIEKIEPAREGLDITFSEKTSVDPEKFLELIKKSKNGLRLVSGRTVKIILRGSDWKARAKEAEKSLRQILAL